MADSEISRVQVTHWKKDYGRCKSKGGSNFPISTLALWSMNAWEDGRLPNKSTEVFVPGTLFDGHGYKREETQVHNPSSIPNSLFSISR